MAKQKPIRVSIIKKEQEQPAGAELLALCLSITDDGVLSKQEIVELVACLNKHRSAELPAIQYLTPIVKPIVADGFPAGQAKKELHIAIERVLPPAYRKLAKQQRRKAEDAERMREYQEYRRTTPLGFDFRVAGVAYEGRSKIVEQYVRMADTVQLVRDKHNKKSKNGTAIKILLNNRKCIGWVPELDIWGDESSDKISEEVSRLLDEGRPYLAVIYDWYEGYKKSIVPLIELTVYPIGTSRSQIKTDEKEIVRRIKAEKKHTRLFGGEDKPANQTGCLSLVLFLLLGLTMLYQFV